MDIPTLGLEKMKEHDLIYIIDCAKGNEHYAYFHCVWDMSYLDESHNILFLYNLEDYRNKNRLHTISHSKIESIIKREEPIFSQYMGGIKNESN